MKRSIITLLTDFGSQDYFVGAMKGVILSINPQATIIDTTHEIPPQDIRAGAFNLLACYKDFPAGTIHVAVVDPGVGSDRRAVMVECANQFFVGPDNGLFSWIYEREGKFSVRQITNESFFRHPLSSTFHGRDVFAPVAAAISNGVKPGALGPVINDHVRLDSLKPTATDEGLTGTIIHIDRFGNCVTNFNPADITENLIAAGAKLNVNGSDITSFHKFFSEADMGDGKPFMIVGSANFIEIVTRNGSAASRLNVRRGDSVSLVTNAKQ